MLSQRTVLALLSLTSFLIVWEGIAWAGIISRTFLPPFSQVLAALVNMLSEVQTYRHLLFTLTNFALGFVIALLVGILLGIVAGWYARVNAFVEPLISIFYTTPMIALLPLIIIVFGVYAQSKIFMTFLGAFFPIIINVITGMKNVNRPLVEMARSFNASDRQIFVTVAVPNTFPFLLAGIRLGLGRGLVFATVAEMYASPLGLGYLISVFANGLTFDYALASVMILAITSLLATLFVSRYELILKSRS